METELRIETVQVNMCFTQVLFHPERKCYLFIIFMSESFKT